MSGDGAWPRDREITADDLARWREMEKKADAEELAREVAARAAVRSAEITESSIADRTGWSDGPWNDEPDRVEWIDADTGLPCAALRCRGHWCGYVAVGEGHPLYRHDYSDKSDALNGESPEGALNVHGGITFSGDTIGLGGGDLRRETLLTAHGFRGDKVYWFGFDCAHWSDASPHEQALSAMYGMRPIHDDPRIYRDLRYVRAEIAALAKQLAEVSRTRGNGNGG